jgi:anti-sigma factor RsiW
VRLADDLTCAELVELVTDYVEGALSDDDRCRFEEHVVFCESCAAHLDQMRATIRVLGRVREEELPPDAVDELLATFRGWNRT